jgi:hypothetical protein
MQKDSKQSSAVFHEERLKTSGVKAKSKLTMATPSYIQNKLQTLGFTITRLLAKWYLVSKIQKALSINNNDGLIDQILIFILESPSKYAET